MNSRTKVFIYYFMLMALMGCQHPSNHQLLTSYIEGIDSRIEDERIRQWIKQSKGEEVIWILEYNGLPLRPDTISETMFLQQRENIVHLYHLPRRYPYQNYFLLAIYRQYLNGVSINPEAAKREASQYEQIIVAWRAQQDRAWIQSKYALMRRNYEKYHVGDTILLTFPFDTSDDSRGVYYPNMFDYPTYTIVQEEALEVWGKVVRKYYRGTNSEVSADSLDHAILQVEILESASPIFRVMSESHTIGDTLDLYLYSYGDSISSPR